MSQTDSLLAVKHNVGAPKLVNFGQRYGTSVWDSWLNVSSWIQSHLVRKDKVSAIQETELFPLTWEEPQPFSEISIADEGPRFASLKHLGPWFPEADPSHFKAQTWRTWRSKRQTVLRAGSVIAALVLLTNIAATVYFKIKWKTAGDIGTIFHGRCTKSARLSSILHIVINVLSTTLLAVSNLCMQLLAAPTRQEVDKAHANFYWLDIGVPSLRNLRYISGRRQIALILLALSSISLHFMYNSTIIPTLAVNTYAYVVVTPEFLRGGPWNTTETAHAGQAERPTMDWMMNSWHGLDLQPTIQKMQDQRKDKTHYSKINNLECLITYDDLLGNRSDFIMVSSSQPSSNNSLLYYGMSTSGTWDIGYGLCDFGGEFDCGRLSEMPLARQQQAVQNWTIGHSKIDYCLSSERSTEELCSVEYSFSIMFIVCIFNAIKCLCIWYTAWTYSHHDYHPLSNVGDAMRSFLEYPDKSTRGMSIVSKKQICDNIETWRSPVAHEYRSDKQRWFHAVSWRRWTLCLALAIATLITASIFLGAGIAGLKNRKFPTDFRSLIHMGFGAVLHLLIPSKSTERALYHSVLFSNLWQFVISLLYLAYNAVLTAMLVADEWDRFGKVRKPLRVTAPQGHQRSTYFVSVPLRWGLPIVIIFGALHYTISQSVFVVYLTRFFSNGVEDIPDRSATSGYSCIAIITSLAIGIILLLFLILVGVLGEYRNGTPLASTCSAAMNAACHRPAHDREAFMFQVQWGVVSHNSRVGHCSFTTAKDVTDKTNRPVTGRKYA